MKTVKYLSLLIIVVALPLSVMAATFSVDSNEVQTDVVDGNTNTNTNTNTNINKNTNTNTNKNTNVPKPPPVNKPVTPPPPVNNSPNAPGTTPAGGTGENGNENAENANANENTNVNLNENIPPPPANVPPENIPPENANVPAIAFLPPNVSAAVVKAGAAVTSAAKVVKEQVIDNPQVQQANNVVIAPATTIATTATAASVDFSFLVYYLYFLFLQPIALLDRRRAKTTGIVYNALTKLPLDLALVRLVDDKSGRLVRTRVTDRTGRVLFIAPPSEYIIGVSRAGYDFPATTMKDLALDPVYKEFYKGEKIKPAAGAPIAPNIPLEPVVAVDTTSKKAISHKSSLAFKHLVASSTTVVCFVAFAITPNFWTGLNFFAQLVVLAAVERFVFKKRVKKVGQVLSPKGKPIRAVVRLFETTYNKLVETIVTDASGKFAFLVGPNKYYAVAEVPGLGTVKSNIFDFTKETGEQIVAPEMKIPSSAPSSSVPPMAPPAPMATPVAPPVKPAPPAPPPVAPPIAPPMAPPPPATPPVFDVK